MVGGLKSLHKFIFGDESAKAACQQSKLVKKLDDWNLDIFALADKAHGNPLSQLVSAIFEKRSIGAEFHIPDGKLENFLRSLDNQHDDQVAYHNSIHAAYAIHCVHLLLNCSALEGTFSSLEIFAALFAAAVHDIGHPGWSNGYMAKIRKENYKGAGAHCARAHLEERHLVTAFQMLDIADCNLLCGLDAVQVEHFKRLVTDIVLATDGARHAEVATAFQRIIRQERSSSNQRIRLDIYDEKLAVLQFILHCADTSDPTKRLKTYQRSVDCLFEEFFRLGDQEKLLGFPMSPMCNRANVNVHKTQVDYITLIAEPLWRLWRQLAMDDQSEAALRSLESNLKFNKRKQ